MRLIDADALEIHDRAYLVNGKWHVDTIYEMADKLQNAPTVDAIPVEAIKNVLFDALTKHRPVETFYFSSDEVVRITTELIDSMRKEAEGQNK